MSFLPSRFYQKSLAISVISGHTFRGIMTQSLASMGIALTILGKQLRKYIFRLCSSCSIVVLY